MRHGPLGPMHACDGWDGMARWDRRMHAAWLSAEVGAWWCTGWHRARRTRHGIMPSAWGVMPRARSRVGTRGAAPGITHRHAHACGGPSRSRDDRCPDGAGPPGCRAVCGSADETMTVPSILSSRMGRTEHVRRVAISQGTIRYNNVSVVFPNSFILRLSAAAPGRLAEPGLDPPLVLTARKRRRNGASGGVETRRVRSAPVSTRTPELRPRAAPGGLAARADTRQRVERARRPERGSYYDIRRTSTASPMDDGC